MNGVAPHREDQETRHVHVVTKHDVLQFVVHQYLVLTMSTTQMDRKKKEGRKEGRTNDIENQPQGLKVEMEELRSVRQLSRCKQESWLMIRFRNSLS